MSTMNITMGFRRFGEVVAEVYREAKRHRVSAESARLAYFFFLALFPAIIILFSVTSMIGREAAFEWILGLLESALPTEASGNLHEYARQIIAGGGTGALSFGLLMTFWLASNTFAALNEGLNAAYHVARARRWWARRAVSLGLLLVGALVLLGGAFAVLAGPEIGRFVGSEKLGSFLRWPLTLSMSIGMMWLTYFILPNHDQSREKRRILVGALVGTALWFGATILFRLYVSNLGRYTVTYGFLGGMVILLVWLYLTALSILVGGEVAAVLERRAHKASGRGGEESTGLAS